MSYQVTFEVTCDFCGKPHPKQVYKLSAQAAMPVPSGLFPAIGHHIACQSCYHAALARLENVPRHKEPQA